MFQMVNYKMESGEKINPGSLSDCLEQASSPLNPTHTQLVAQERSKHLL